MLAELGRLDKAGAALVELAVEGSRAVPADLGVAQRPRADEPGVSGLGDRSAPRSCCPAPPVRRQVRAEGPTFLGAVDRFLAMLATTARSVGRRRPLVRVGPRRPRELRCVPFVVLTRGDWAAMLLARGRRPTAPVMQLVDTARPGSRAFRRARRGHTTDALWSELDQPLLRWRWVQQQRTRPFSSWPPP